MKKLDMRGVSQDILLVAFLLIFAVVGTGYLVASHADSCTPETAPVGGASCIASFISCKVSGVPTTVVPAGQTIKPRFTIYNKGKGSAKFNVYVDSIADISPGGHGGPLSSTQFVQQLRAGHSSTHLFKPYKVGTGQFAFKIMSIKYQVSFTGHTGIPACSATATLSTTKP